MQTLLIAAGAAIAFTIAYHTYGRWLGSKIFNLAADTVCPSQRLRDDKDYVPTPKPVVFGHHFTSIAGTGPIVGPAIAVMWGWLPALLWVVLGSIFIGAVHDFGALVVSLRNNGQTVGDIAGRVLNRRVRMLFLFVLFMALTIVLAIFGLVIAAVFKQYPAAIFPCLIQIPIAVWIGVYIYRKGRNIFLPSTIALAVMYLTVIYGNAEVLGEINNWLSSLSVMWWVTILLVYSYIASVLPVWSLLQPRDYINSLQLISALALIVVGLGAAAFIGGAPPVEGADRPPLEIAAPMVDLNPRQAPLIFPFLFITIACGAISGFHCLVSSGTSSKQLRKETDAKFVGFGSMLTEGFLATLVILACVAGLGLGVVGKPTKGLDFAQAYSEPLVPTKQYVFLGPDKIERNVWLFESGKYSICQPMCNGASELPLPRDLPSAAVTHASDGFVIDHNGAVAVVGSAVYNTRYQSWRSAGGLKETVGAFVDGSANFLKSLGIPGGIAIALMGVLVASFAGTTLDTACRLQRYVVQELAATFLPAIRPTTCAQCAYDLTDNVSGKCPECGISVEESWQLWTTRKTYYANRLNLNPLTWLVNKHGATIFSVIIAGLMAFAPLPGQAWSWANAGKGGLILWPMFGATNQLLAGLSFLVITFYLWQRKKPVFFVVLPLLFMLLMPAWAMFWQLFVQGIGMETSWLAAQTPNWPLIAIAIATLALEFWMIAEAVLLIPRVKSVILTRC